MIKVNEVTTLAAQVMALSKKFDSLFTQKSAMVMACHTCGGGHDPLDVSIVGMAHGPVAQVDFVVVPTDSKRISTVACTTVDGEITLIFLRMFKDNNKNLHRGFLLINRLIRDSH